MNERYQQITGRPMFDASQPHNQMPDYNWHPSTNFTEGNRCNANSGGVSASSFPDSSRTCPSTAVQSATNNTYLNMQQQQQYPHQYDPHPFNEFPQPLMALRVNPPENIDQFQVNNAVATPPDNGQAIKLLQSILSHLITTSQLNGQVSPVSPVPLSYP